MCVGMDQTKGYLANDLVPLVTQAQQSLPHPITGALVTRKIVR